MRFAVYRDLSRTENRGVGARPIRTWSRRVTSPCFASIQYREVQCWGGVFREPGLGWSIQNVGQIGELALHRIEQEIMEEDIWDISVPDVHPEENKLFPEDYQVDRLRHYLSTEGGPTVLRDEERVSVRTASRTGRLESVPLAPLIEPRIPSEVLLRGQPRRVWVYTPANKEIAEERVKATSFFLVQT